ncbi:hypothetical protein Tco_0415113 [Tanacetum coccineum]
MRTRNSNFLNNLNVTIPRRRNKRRAPNILEPELRTIIAPMAERTMEELLRAPTEGYGEAIVLPEINADHFEIKTNLLQLVQANPFHGLENENPHAHINSFKRITSTLRFRNVSNDVIKLMMFPYSLEGDAKTCEVWERFKEMLRACPHHGFTELTQIDTFYNGLNDNDQDSLNAAAGGNLLSKTTREALNIIENKSKVRYSRNNPNASRMNTTSRESVSKTDERIDKLADQLSTLVEIVSKKVVTPALIKAVEETCVTCGGAHSWYNCPATDNNQASVCVTTGTYNQVNPPNHVSNQMAPAGFAPVQNNGQNRNSNSYLGFLEDYRRKGYALILSDVFVKPIRVSVVYIRNPMALCDDEASKHEMHQDSLGLHHTLTMRLESIQNGKLKEENSNGKNGKLRLSYLWTFPRKHMSRFHGRDDVKGKSGKPSEQDFNIISQLEAHGAEVSTCGCKNHNFPQRSKELRLVLHEDWNKLMDLDIKEYGHKLAKHTEDEETNHARSEVSLCSKTCMIIYALKTLCDEQMNQLGDQEAQILAYSQAVKKLEASTWYRRDKLGKPLYSRFIKANDFKGVPHPLSGDYTPKPQEEINESLYVYGKKGPQEPEPNVSDDRSRVPSEVYVSTPMKTTEKELECDDGKENLGMVTLSQRRKFCCGSLSHLIKDCDYYEKRMTKVAEVRIQRALECWYQDGIYQFGKRDGHRCPVPTRTSNNFSPKRPQGKWGSVVKTSVGSSIDEHGRIEVANATFMTPTPAKCFACLIAKATSDESKLWHRRLLLAGIAWIYRRKAGVLRLLLVWLREIDFLLPLTLSSVTVTGLFTDAMINNTYLADVTLTKRFLDMEKGVFNRAPRPLLPAMCLLLLLIQVEHTFEEPSPAHQYFSPPQEHPQGQMTVDDLLQLVPQLEEEEPEAQGRKSQDDHLVSLVQGLVTPSKTTVNALGEEQVEWKGYRVGVEWGKVRDSCRGVLERWFGAENRGRGWFDFGGKLVMIGCNWARIGPSKSSQSLSIAHKWAVEID